MMSSHDVSAIAGRLTAAIASADTAALAEIYAPGALIWHNTDEVELTVAQLLDVAAAIGEVATADIDVRDLHPTPTGFVQTQVNTYTFADGSTASFHAALVVVLDDEGRVALLDEYLDSAGLQPLLDALGGG